MCQDGYTYNPLTGLCEPDCGPGTIYCPVIDMCVPIGTYCGYDKVATKIDNDTVEYVVSGVMTGTTVTIIDVL